MGKDQLSGVAYFEINGVERRQFIMVCSDFIIFTREMEE
jgi:hypothetical protein